MKKRDAEAEIRSLCHEWRRQTGRSTVPPQQLNFSEFLEWLRQNSPGHLRFRSIAGARYDVELWFDQEFGQTSQR